MTWEHTDGIFDIQVDRTCWSGENGLLGTAVRRVFRQNSALEGTADLDVTGLTTILAGSSFTGTSSASAFDFYVRRSNIFVLVPRRTFFSWFPQNNFRPNLKAKIASSWFPEATFSWFSKSPSWFPQNYKFRPGCPKQIFAVYRLPPTTSP